MKVKLKVTKEIAQLFDENACRCFKTILEVTVVKYFTYINLDKVTLLHLF